MIHSLYAKLALALFVLVVVVGFGFFSLVRFATDMYQQETAQKLNQSLAAHIVAETPLLQKREVNRPALEHLFHQLMVINPSIEVYLLGEDGAVLAYSAPQQKLAREQVDTGPILRFLQGDLERPLLGDDPRGRHRQKVFSAAAIESPGQREGYLYVILGGERYDTVAALLRASYSLRVSAWGIAAGGLIAFIAALAVFSLLTRRLRHLARDMRFFATQQTQSDESFTVALTRGDEIDQLNYIFSAMAARIAQQMMRLQQSDAQRRELVANVSHDLRTPLASLRGYLETLLIKDQTLEAVQRQRYLSIALASSDQLAGLIESLFELAKLDATEAPLRVEPFCAADLAHDVVLKHQLAARDKGVDIDLAFDKALPFATGDIAMIERALNNLIDNAIEHTPRGGRVCVSLRACSDRVHVSVSDTGVGIAQELLPHIFERFYRVQKSRKDGARHAGLGLAITKRIVELHGEQIVAESALNRGTCFSFALPGPVM